MTLMLCACILIALMVGLGLVLRSTWQFRRHLAQVDAAMAAEAPWPALSHVRIMPPDDDLGGAGTPDAGCPSVDGLGKALPGSEPVPDDDVYVRILKALDVFAEDNGYEVPAPLLWLGIACATATAILGEDLAAVLRGDAS